MDTFSADAKNIAALLGDSERRPIIVPQFQRPYSWGNKHVSAFWDDILEFSRGYEKEPFSSYFLGPIVLKSSASELTLLDGQQRFATITILLCVIRDAANNLADRHIGAQELARDLQRNYIEKPSSKTGFALKLGELDDDFFRENIQASSSSSSLRANLKSQRNLEKARNQLNDKLQELIGKLPIDKRVQTLHNLWQSITRGLVVVAIFVTNEGDAFGIFETLNDRGLRLSVPDLLLNLLMKLAPGEAAREETRRNWNQMLTRLARADSAKYLRHWWVGRYGDVKSHSLYNVIKAELEIGKWSSQEFTSICSNSAIYYAALLEQDPDIISAQSMPYVEGLVKHLSVQAALPLLMVGLEFLSPQDFEKLTLATLNFAVRHSFLANLNTAELEDVLFSASRQLYEEYLSKSKGQARLSAVIELLDKKSPSDSLILEKAKTCELTKNSAEFLLRFAAEDANEKLHFLQVFDPTSSSRSWPNRAALEDFAWNIGNLTLVDRKVSKSESKASFKEKKKKLLEKSTFGPNKSIAKMKDWTEASIERQALELVKRLTEQFPKPQAAIDGNKRPA